MENSLASTIQAANRSLIVDGNMGAVGDFFAPDYVVHLTDGVLKGGHGTIQKILGTLRRSFPDIQIEVEILLESGTRVAWLRTLRGAHKAAFKGFPASGLEIVWRDMVTSQFRDGLISEEWVVTDLTERLLLSKKV